jgi:cytidine deaminase
MITGIQARGLSALSGSDRDIVIRAQESSRFAYAPYSGFAVGVAVRTQAGNLYTGANLENASYGLSICAEVSALTAANSKGDFQIVKLAVVGHKFSVPVSYDRIVTPCGRCRQLIYEASQISKIDIGVFCCSGDLSEIVEMKISELLPAAFGPDDLGLGAQWHGMRQKLNATVDKLTSERILAG